MLLAFIFASDSALALAAASAAAYFAAASLAARSRLIRSASSCFY
jgi:hypothetical protein